MKTKTNILIAVTLVSYATFPAAATRSLSLNLITIGACAKVVGAAVGRPAGEFAALRQATGPAAFVAFLGRNEEAVVE